MFNASRGNGFTPILKLINLSSFPVVPGDEKFPLSKPPTKNRLIFRVLGITEETPA